MSAWVAILLAGAAAYATSLQAGFIFDDFAVIVENPLVRHLWPLTESARNTIRPIVQWSFAANYAVGGLRPAGYHAANLLIHLLAALTLYGVLRRSLSNPTIPVAIARRAGDLALAVTLLWVVHPLTTQSVTYVVQRAESLMGLWYLLTLYSVIRSADSPHPRRWEAAAIVCCGAGMLTKAVMVTAPLMVLLYDRTMLAGSFRAAWQRRRFLYTGLALTWGVLGAVLLAVLPGHEATVGFGLREPSALQYAAAQPGVILHYLRLAVWPAGLCLDYSWPFSGSIRHTLPQLLAVLGALAMTAWGLKRNRPLALAGAWCLIILAPTSSVIPVADAAAEHRMYLPLAGVLLLLVLGADRALRRRMPDGRAQQLAAAGLLACAVMALGALTVLRNQDYRSEVVMWQDVAAKRPSNARAHNNLGQALAAEGRLAEARVAFSDALRLRPAYADAHYNLGLAYAKEHAWEKSVAHYREALRLKPEDDAAHTALGLALAAQGDADGAMRHYEEALRLNPHSASAHNNLANLLARTGRSGEAIGHFERALAITPQDRTIQDNLERALTSGR